MDVSIFFYNAATMLTSDSNSMSPKFVLSMINKITLMDGEKESAAGNINKTTISIILNSYPFDSGVDPNFVQSMYTYMQTNPTSQIPESLTQLTFKDAEMAVTLMPDFIKSRPSHSVELCYTSPDEYQWIPTSSNTQRCNQNIILKFTQALPAVYDKSEAADAFAPPTFTKVIKQFERVTASMLNMENIALVEVDDEDKDEDTEDDTTTLQNESSVWKEKLDLNPEEIEMLLSQTNQEEENEGELVISAERAYGSRSHSAPNSTKNVDHPVNNNNFDEVSVEYAEVASSAGYSADGFNSVTAVLGEELKSNNEDS